MKIVNYIAVTVNNDADASTYEVLKIETRFLKNSEFFNEPEIQLLLNVLKIDCVRNEPDELAWRTERQRQRSD